VFLYEETSTYYWNTGQYRIKHKIQQLKFSVQDLVQFKKEKRRHSKYQFYVIPTDNRVPLEAKFTESALLVMLMFDMVLIDNQKSFVGIKYGSKK
jgi:hypothetical protein